MPPKTIPVDPNATPRASRRHARNTRSLPAASLDESPSRGNSQKTGGSRSHKADNIVYKTLLLKLPGVPEMQSFSESGSSTHSRAPGKDELDIKQSQQLHKVVPCPGIMHNLLRKLEESLKARRPPAGNDPFMFLLTIEGRCAHLPGRICSEHDTAHWVHSAILRPAIAVVQYLLNNNTVTQDFPNISSVGGSPPVPDSVMFKYSRDAHNAVLTIEFKTHRALGGDWTHAIHELLARAKNSDIPGAAAKFHWPDYEVTEFDKATKVLLQVWGQMRKWDANYAILSSYEYTYFLYKPELMSDTLYITDGFESDNSDLLPATVSFLALALGHYSPSDLGLPEPNIEHWNRASMVNFESTGLVPSTYPPSAQAVNVKRHR
ncbi:hypothetical protein PC9H_000408 [Pleurotus ostreatus]|uniref:Uncharacterized protein n=1 Tax=Pleurotus ostreatus TaxID=5322 RepID=A0A8H7A515_PLEOS|nr:uncharacterized protein PC9H_000408 [Pleurotus ostreatus]KAF7440066.1 hypothetical protein PC9H_000408 [Pleurotus ostreatus]KAJ8700688.1 hypothetical protein PTI98_003691 [Pleurotus ostreatus]